MAGEFKASTSERDERFTYSYEFNSASLNRRLELGRAWCSLVQLRALVRCGPVGVEEVDQPLNLDEYEVSARFQHPNTFRQECRIVSNLYRDQRLKKISHCGLTHTQCDIAYMYHIVRIILIIESVQYVPDCEPGGYH